MRKVEALLKVLLNLADHIMYLIPVIDLSLSSLCCTAFLLLLYQPTVSSTLMFLTMEGYQADFLESVDTRCRRIGDWLLICRQVTDLVTLDSNHEVVQAVDRKDTKEATNALRDDWRRLVRVQIMLHSLKALLIDSDRAA